MTELLKECQDCARGRKTFREVKGMIDGSIICPARRAKMHAEWDRMIERTSNCGNPKCPNLAIERAKQWTENQR